MSRMLRMVLVMGFAAGISMGGAAIAAAPAGAAVNGYCGDITSGVLHSGQSLRQGHTSSLHLQVFNERQNVTLSSNVAVDLAHPGLYSTPASLPSPRPILATGAVVSSYLIHGDLPVGTAPRRFVSTVGFSSDIVGVQLRSATLGDASVGQLRFPGVTYATNFSGLELVASGHGDFVRMIDARTLEVSSSVAGEVDDVRVITRGTATSVSALAGYRILAADGGVFDFGGQQFYGSTGGRVLNQPIVSGVNTCGNGGYWFVARDGGVFAYGDATFHGSLGGTTVSSPVVALAATSTGGGYYLAQADGGVNPYGDAQFYDNVQGHKDLTYLHLNAPIVGMATTPTAHGYWLLGGDGGIFSFGDAEFHGSTGALRLVSPVIGFAPTRDGHGYWLFAADGGIFTFGDATFHGSVGGSLRTHPVVGMRVTASGNGYWLTDSAGTVYPFGDAAFAGDMRNVTLFRPMIGMM